MNTLADVHGWLETLCTDRTVDVASSMFDAPLVNALFALLPDTHSISLTIAEVDAPNARLSGTATAFGEPGTTAEFAFSQPAEGLVCELTLKLPSSVSWSLPPIDALTFRSLEARLAPNPELGVVGLSFSSTITAGSGIDAVNIDVTFTVPSFDGDWLLAGDCNSVTRLSSDGCEAIASLTANDLRTLGGHDLAGILPGAISDLSFVLTEFAIAFSPTHRTCSLIRVETRSNGSWTFFDDHFKVSEVNLAFDVLEPFRALHVQARLFAQMQIPGWPAFDVGGQFPDNAVFVQLIPNSALNLSATFKFFGVPLPANFPGVEISTLCFTLFPADASFNFQLGISNPVPILGSAKLDSFFFDLDATYDAPKILATGQIAGTFTVGATTLALSGIYTAGGVTLAGSASNVLWDDLLAKLQGPDFGISSVPCAIRNMRLASLTAQVDTITGRFSFTCTGSTEIAGKDVFFEPTIVAALTGREFVGSFGGKLVLPAPTGKLEFSVTFEEPAYCITATFAEPGGALNVDHLAAALDVNLPAILPYGDLPLNPAGFNYDFSNRSLVVF
jgi:hypothetical protein